MLTVKVMRNDGRESGYETASYDWDPDTDSLSIDNVDFRIKLFYGDKVFIVNDIGKTITGFYGPVGRSPDTGDGTGACGNQQ